METLNIQCIEQQQVLITLTLTDSNGTPVDLTQYAVYAASVGAVDPYCRRAARLEWAAAINNECSAFIVTAPGHDIARAPWKYTIYIKNRQLGLEWAVVSGRVELTPRACGTDGISPAAYSVACEGTPSGLVNVSLDATVGSISGTLEEVKAAAALASSSAANAHADLEDARKAATTAAQAATTAAADANNAMDAAARAEKAATDAPQACAPFVGQVQAAAVQVQQAATHAEEDANRASTAATTATEKAQIATDAATAAATASSGLASARDTAVQAATTAQAAQQTAQLASTTATTAAENAREYAEDAQQARQAAATSETNASTAAQQASASASAAAASAQSAQASAATAVSAKSDLETARDTATAAATTATDAATAAATSESNATAAATAAATAQTAAEAAQAQADTDARACAVYDQRVAANATAATDAATTATEAATTATEAAATATEAAAQADYQYAETLYVATKNYPDGVTYGALQADGTYKYAIVKNAKDGGYLAKTPIIIVHGDCTDRYKFNSIRCFYSDDALRTPQGEGLYNGPFTTGDVYLHAPNATKAYKINGYVSPTNLVMSPATRFDKTTAQDTMFADYHGTVTFADGTTFSALVYGVDMFTNSSLPDCLPDSVTFESVTDARSMFRNCQFTKLPKSMNLSKCVKCDINTFICRKMEIDDIVRVCMTLPDLTALETPTTSQVGIANTCVHNGEAVPNTQGWIDNNYPDFLPTLNARGWTVTFA